MSTFSNPFIRISAGISIAPDAAFTPAARPLKLAAEFTVATASAGGYAARVIFGAAAQSVLLRTDGGMDLIPAGTRQVETATVTAAAGASADGNLTVTVTMAGLAGSPLALAVPLLAAVHTTDAKIAAAIAAAINANAACAAAGEALPTGAATVAFRAKFPAANDLNFNLAIGAGLGVTAAATSATTTAGVAGVVVERLGGDPGEARDAFGDFLGNITVIGYVASVPADSPGPVAFDGSNYQPGGCLAKFQNSIGSAEYEVFSVGTGVVELLVLTQ